MILFVGAGASGSLIGDRMGSEMCRTGDDTSVEQRQSVAATAAEFNDGPYLARLIYFFLFGSAAPSGYVDGRCSGAGCTPFLPLIPTADPWRYTWADGTIDVCVRDFASAAGVERAVVEGLRGLDQTNLGVSLELAEVKKLATPCGVEPVFDPNEGPPIRARGRLQPGPGKTYDLFVLVYPDAALADFSPTPVKRLTGQEAVSGVGGLRVVSTAVYVTVSELHDLGRLTLLLGIGLGIDPRR